MPANIEIKARIPSIEDLLPRAIALADERPQRFTQDDIFFDVTHGRLKLRVFGDGSGELIHYVRANGEAPRMSDYRIAPVIDPQTLRETLARACGEIGRVRKQRTLLLVGRTRIHLDRVEGLGEFLELEVVLRDGETEDAGRTTALALMAQLGVDADALVGRAYLDLLTELE